MEMLIPGLCGLVVIIGLVAVVMSRANWSIPQLVLVGFVILASLVFFYFSARTLVLARNYNDELKKYAVAIHDVEKGKSQGTQIIEKGIEQFRQERDQGKHDVEIALANRGRAWHEANMVRANPDTGEITISVDDPTPHGIDQKSTLFVFEQSDKGKYLGEFVVTSAKEGDKLIKMVPSLALTQGELTGISSSRGKLDLYEIMPADSHALFASYDNRDDALKAAFSKDVVPEYMKDFAPATDDDLKSYPDRIYQWVRFTKDWTADRAPGEKPAAAVAGANPAGAAAPVQAEANGAGGNSFKTGDVALFDAKSADDLKAKGVAEDDKDHPSKLFVRELRDYAQIFREAIRQRSEINAEIAEITAQAARVAAAKTEVQDDIAALTKERDGLKSDLAKFQAEREIATAFVAAIEKRNEDLRAELSRTFRDNIRMASDLDETNHRLLEEINRRNPPVQAQASLAPIGR